MTTVQFEHNLDIVLALVRAEVLRSIRDAGFPLFNSSHEGYAVILEEMDELWDAIKRGKPPWAPTDSDQKGEAIQVAAMAIKLTLGLG